MFSGLAKFLPWKRKPEERALHIQNLDSSVTGLPWGATSVELSLTYAPVWQAVQTIAGDVSRMPLIIEQRSENGVWERNYTHPLNALIRSPEESGLLGPRKFWHRVMVNLLFWQNAYMAIRADGFELLESDLITYSNSSDGELMYLYNHPSKGGTEAFFEDEIIHFEGIYLDRDGSIPPPQPISLVRQFWLSISAGKSSEAYMDAFFRNGGRLGGILELPTSMSPKAKTNVEEGFRKTYEAADAAFKTVILRDNAKFHANQARPSDGQMTEARDSMVADIARWFCLPPHKLGLERQKAYGSLTEENKAYFTGCLSYWTSAIADELSTKMLTDRQRIEFRFAHDSRRLTTGSMEELVTWGDTAVQGQLVTRNEWRQFAGLPPVEGGDEFETTRNSETQQQQEPAAAAGDGGEDDDSEE